MPDIHYDSCEMTVTSVAGAGLGTLTLSTTPITGRRKLPTGADGTTISIETRNTSGDWETATGCVIGGSGTTVTRGTRSDSSAAGAAVAFAAGATVSVAAVAEFGNRATTLMQLATPGGRLTLESGVPVSTTDQTAKTSIFYTPYVHNGIVLWDGADWVPTTFTERTLALGTLTNARPYDVFAYFASGVVTLELLAWTSDTARATAVTLQDGRYCKSGDKTRLLLGTFYTTSTTATESSLLNRYVGNVYNRVQMPQKSAAGAAHTYNTSTLRQWNAGSGAQPQINFVLPLTQIVKSTGQAFMANLTATPGMNSILRLYLDNTTDMTQTDSQVYITAINQGSTLPVSGVSVGVVGRHSVNIWQAEYGGSAITYDKGLTFAELML